MGKSRKHHLRAKKEKRIARTLTRHHAMRAKSRGGTYHPSNIMLLTWERHRLLHQLFGLKSIPEIIEVLLHWCKYRHILNGENDKGQIYEHFRRRFSEVE